MDSRIQAILRLMMNEASSDGEALNCRARVMKYLKENKKELFVDKISEQNGSTTNSSLADRATILTLRSDLRAALTKMEDMTKRVKYFRDKLLEKEKECGDIALWKQKYRYKERDFIDLQQKMRDELNDSALHNKYEKVHRENQILTQNNIDFGERINYLNAEIRQLRDVVLKLKEERVAAEELKRHGKQTADEMERANKKKQEIKENMKCGAALVMLIIVFAVAVIVNINK